MTQNIVPFEPAKNFESIKKLIPTVLSIGRQGN